MKNPLRSAIRLVFEKCGYRIFRRDQFYHSFIPYNRYGTDFIHYIRHFVDIGDVRTCLDVGANKGQTAKYFSDVFPAATIYSFEPVAGTFSQLLENTRQLPRVKSFNFALGRSAGSIDIVLAGDDQLNSLVADHRQNRPEGAPTETIQIRTLDSFIAEEGLKQIHLLKIDTEGFELEVLGGASAAFAQQRIDLVYCEVCFDPKDTLHTYFDRILQFLKERDFLFLGLYDTVFCDNPTQLFHANALFGRKNAAVIKPWVD